MDLDGLLEELAGSVFPKTMCQYDLGAIFIMTFTDFTDYRVISHGRCLSDKSASVVFGRDENVQLFEKVI